MITAVDKGILIEELMFVMFGWPSLRRKSILQNYTTNVFEDFVF